MPQPAPGVAQPAPGVAQPAPGVAQPALIDTDVMVDFLRGNPRARQLLKRESTNAILSCIVVAELYAGVRGEQELHTLDSLVSLFRVVPVSPELARAGGLHKKDYAASHGVGLADAIVAATAQSENAVLLTLNTKHYPMIKGLKAAYKRA